MQVIALLLSLCLVYTVKKLLTWWKAVQSVHNFPGQRTLISANSFLGSVLPKIKYITPGRNQLFVRKHDPFKEIGWDIYSSITVFPSIRTSIIVSDAAAVKELTAARARYPKPVHFYGALKFYGPNIVASEGDEWKKYRKLSAPSFSDRNNALVWNESVKTVKEMFTDLWDGRDTITVDHCVDITLPIALFIIGAAGFGRSISWKENIATPPAPGYTMTFKEALHIVTSNFIIKLVAPSWAKNLSAKVRETEIAFDEIRRYILDMIHERQNAEKTERHDLLGSLLDANDNMLDVASLTEEELIGNIYIFLVAGHETSAHTLCYTFGLLALYPDEQEKLFEHIKSVIKEGADPSYEQMPLLTYANAVLYETLRMFPSVTGIPKMAAEDMTLTTGNSQGETIRVPIPKGAYVTVNVPGLHYNPRYWDDPHTFKPSRFLEDWPRDAFVPFSAGPRACIGRKFAETESIAILVTMVSNYKISVKEEPQFANETFEQRKARVLNCRSGLTLTPVRTPLTFTRR